MSSDRLTRSDTIRIYKMVMHDVLGIPDASHQLHAALDRNDVTSLIPLLSLSSSEMDRTEGKTRSFVQPRNPRPLRSTLVVQTP
jgi:hypothetical protein